MQNETWGCQLLKGQGHSSNLTDENKYKAFSAIQENALQGEDETKGVAEIPTGFGPFYLQTFRCSTVFSDSGS